MPKLKQMVKRTNVEIAKRKRKCKYTGKEILKDTLCMVLYEGSRDRYCYSRDVAIQMIHVARERLEELERELS